jgi:two-component system OmpR family response regulator
MNIYFFRGPTQVGLIRVSENPRIMIRRIIMGEENPEYFFESGENNTDKMETSNQTSNRGRILIVTDELNLIMPLCDLLLSHGYEVSGYSSGKKALAALREQDFDLLLTEFKMSEMEGLEVLRSALNIKPTLFGIILIGHDSIQSIIEVVNAGAFDYVLKPVNLNELMQTISRAMEMKPFAWSSKLRR